MRRAAVRLPGGNYQQRIIMLTVVGLESAYALAALAGYASRGRTASAVQYGAGWAAFFMVLTAITCGLGAAAFYEFRTRLPHEGRREPW